MGRAQGAPGTLFFQDCAVAMLAGRMIVQESVGSVAGPIRVPGAIEMSVVVFCEWMSGLLFGPVGLIGKMQ